MIVNLDSRLRRRPCLKKATAAGRQDHRLRPPDARRRRVVLRVASTTSQVGALQGEGLVKCLQADGKTDGQRRLAQRLADRQQRHAVQAGLRQGAQAEDDRLHEWSPTRPCPTGTTPRPARSSSRCYTQDKRQDRRRRSRPTTASAARSSPVLEAQRPRRQGPGHRSGRHATRACSAILAGDQCMTVYKAIKKEADAAVRRWRSRWPRATRRRPTRWPPARSRTPRPNKRRSSPCC